MGASASPRRPRPRPLQLLLPLLALGALQAVNPVGAILHTDLFNGTEVQDPDISITYSLPGVKRAVTESDLEPLLRDNLEPDLRPWRAKGRKLTSRDFLDFLHQIDTEWLEYRRHFIAIVRIKDNKMRWWAYPNARGWCTRRVQTIQDVFHGFIKKAGVKFPDVVYVMNGYDKALCEAGNCSAPIFTFDKRWHYSNGSSPYDDILHPVMNHPFEELISYPWEKKIEKGFMRVGLYGAMAANCSRVQVHRLGQSKEGKELLDVGVYQNRHWKVKLKTVAPVPMEAHAKWKYQINTDGQSASWRLAKLLAIDSPILKYRSDNIEYYYRSLKEGVNYASVDHTDLLPTIRQLRGSKARDAQLQDMVARNREFAYRYLSQHSRTLYAAVSLQRYAQLFTDMKSFVASVPEKFSMEWFLKQREKLIAAEGKGTKSKVKES